MNQALPIDIEQAEADTGGHPVYAQAPRSVEFNKLRKRLIRNTREAIDKFAMARPGERRPNRTCPG